MARASASSHFLLLVDSDIECRKFSTVFIEIVKFISVLLYNFKCKVTDIFNIHQRNLGENKGNSWGWLRSGTSKGRFKADESSEQSQ